MNIHNTIIFLFILIPMQLEARIERKVLGDNIRIKPNTSYKLSIKSSSPVPLDIYANLSTPCKDKCLSIKRTDQQHSVTFSTATGASWAYPTINGAIEIEYGNISDSSITINIHQSITHCDAQSCSVLETMGISDPIGNRYKIGEHKALRIASIESIKTNKDGSWSDVKGKTIYGDAFDVSFVWWLYDPMSEVSCGRGSYINMYKKKLDSGKGPALIAGTVITKDRSIFMYLDTCTGNSSFQPKTSSDF